MLTLELPRIITILVYITYCLSACGAVFTCSQSTQTLDRHRTRIVSNLVDRFYPSNICIFKSVKLLKLVDIYHLIVANYMYKIINLNNFESIRENLQLSYPTHDYPTKNRGNLITPFPRVNSIKSNYEYQIVSVGNGIPEHIEEMSPFRSFKTKLIKYFLEQY